jgi:hypothetical protein
VVLRRYPVSLATVLIAALAMMVFFAVARPRYEPAVDVEHVDLSRQAHYSVADVRSAFAANGIRLNRTAEGLTGITMLGAGSLPWEQMDLVVTVLPEIGTVGIGHGEWEEETFERRVGNVLVQYGGTEGEVVERVERALTTLRPILPPRGGALAR